MNYLLDTIFKLVLVVGTTMTAYFVLPVLSFLVILAWTTHYFIDDYLSKKDEDVEEKEDPVVSTINYSLMQQDIKYLKEKVVSLTKKLEESK